MLQDANGTPLCAGQLDRQGHDKVEYIGEFFFFPVNDVNHPG